MGAALTLKDAARFVDRAGFALLMPHGGLPLPSLFEAIRGKPGGHPFRPWTKASDLMWDFKDALPAKGLAYYGALWAGKPGFASVAMLPHLMKLWGTPPGEDGFRAAYRAGKLSFDAQRLAEALLAKGRMNTWRLRTHTGVKPSSFKRAQTELERTLIVARCGADDNDTTWAASVLDLTARVFPRADGEARRISYLEAREEALATMAAAAPKLSPKQVARLLRTGAG